MPPIDPVTTTALSELIKTGVIGTILVLFIIGSATGLLRWGAQVKEQLADKNEQITSLRAQCKEATDGWREQIEATRQGTAALDKLTAIVTAVMAERRGAS